MDNERTAVITIGDEEYTLLLTTKATKEIAGRYGGLENLGEKLMKSENFEMAIGYKTAITEALYKGTKRNVESEKDSKNAQVG